MGPGTLEEQILNVRLNIFQPDCDVLRLGHDGPRIDWHIHTHRALQAIIRQPGRKLGSSYVRGDWDVDGQQLAALIDALVPQSEPPRLFHKRFCLRHLRARLPYSRRATAYPYWQDHNLWLSRTCLGNNLFQHCAFYDEPGISTEQAQRTRNHDILKRLQLRRGQHLLDLNAGWGTLAIYLAEQTGIRVTAMVRTREQLQFAHSEARRRGLDGQVHFRLGSFQQCRGHYDRVLACGFLEQFAETTYPALFEQLESLLHDDGLAWIQVTGLGRAAGLSHQWHRRQLPARCSLPLLSDLVSSLETTGLRSLTLEDQSAHQLQDLQTRAKRFQRQRLAISQRFGETHTRYWEFLLASQISAFRRGQLRHYEFLLGNTHCQWQAVAPGRVPDEGCLPMEIAQKIPGLARDL